MFGQKTRNFSTQDAVLGVLGQILERVKRIFEVIEDSQKNYEAVLTRGQFELRVQIHIINLDPRAQRFFEQARTAQPVLMGCGVIDELDFARSEFFQHKTKITIRAADIGHGLVADHGREVAPLALQQRIQVMHVGERPVGVPGKVGLEIRAHFVKGSHKLGQLFLQRLDRNVSLVLHSTRSWHVGRPPATDLALQAKVLAQRGVFYYSAGVFFRSLNHKKIVWFERILLALVVGSYLVLTLVKVKYPGIYASEITHAPSIFGLPHAPALVKIGNFPILVMAYYGAVKVYIGWIFFKVLGVSVLAIRLPWILCTAGGLIALYYGLRKYTNRTIAFTTLILLVLDPTFVAQTKLDSGPVALEFLIKASVLGLWATLLKRGKLLLLLPIWLLLALGEYNKLNFLWFVNSFYAAVVLVYWRTLLSWWRTGTKKIRLGLAAFFAGYVALIGYFVLIQERFKILSYSDNAFNLRDRVDIIFDQFQKHVQGSIFYNFALGTLAEPWMPWFFWGVIGLTTLGLIIIAAKRTLRKSIGRQTVFILLLVLSTLAQIIATKSAKAPWHLFALFPYFTILTASAIYAIAQLFGQKIKWVIVGLVLLGFTIPGVWLHARYLDTYDDPAKNIHWSAAIYDVLDYTKASDAKFVCVDWGTYTPLAVLDPVKGKYLNHVWYFRRELPERYAETAQNLFDPKKGHLFILQDGERAYFKDAQKNFYASLKASGYTLEPVLSAGQGASPDFTIYRTK